MIPIKRHKEREKKQFNSGQNTDPVRFPLMHYTHCLWGILGSRFWPPDRSLLQWRTCTKSTWFLHAVLASPFYVLSHIPISFKLRRHSHYHPIKVTVEAFLSPYLSPISQKLQTSYKLLWIGREKLFRLTRRNMASLHAHRCDTIAFLVLFTSVIFVSLHLSSK